jgi:hypothetical protein
LRRDIHRGVELMADSVMFDADSARRIGEAVRRMEASGLGGPTGDNPQRRPADPIQILKITGSVSSGLYPAKVSWWNDGAAVETLSDEVRWKPRDGSAPAVNDYVWGRYAGPVADGSKGLYVGAKSAGGSGLVYQYTCSGGSLIETVVAAPTE